MEISFDVWVGVQRHGQDLADRVAQGSYRVAAAAAAAATGSATAASAGGVAAGGADGLDEEEDGFGCEIGTFGNFKKAKGTVNVSATYNTSHHDFETSVVARGDLWRLESLRGGLNSGNENTPLFLVQLGPLLFVRDSTLLLPVHLSKQHLLGMAMIASKWFFPLFGGLLQAHGKCPGESRVSFSFKSKKGTRFTPMFQWPDNSVSFGIAQALACKKSGLIVRPSIQVRHPSAFTAVSLGRSKWNGQVGSSGLVITLETPLHNMARPSLSVQLNGGFEF
ncbi:hypothetical protein GUJ93_ZPchr0010g9675 [Zizania palustris]|uniref:Uncharacterized protein n=1 Tax=Zizania palustris TaxID=103762 RepID=A0A8J6BNV1_ZIZPA|nr:hypothetical protein GUJ93_ZPchr0010g9675 [Zizania palustris]